MSANDRQVGGDHYASTYQHWDFVADALQGRYLEGCVTKYATRWRKKNGLQDLEKAQHFLAKLRDQFIAGKVAPMPAVSAVDTLLFIHRFEKANALWYAEREICRVLSQWNSLGDLDFAADQLDRLVRSAREYRDRHPLDRAEEAGPPSYAEPSREYVDQG